MVVPSYRLMPGAPHPAQIEDATAAVEWVVKNIAQYGGDPKRMYLGGHSAGGHLKTPADCLRKRINELRLTQHFRHAICAAGRSYF